MLFSAPVLCHEGGVALGELFVAIGVHQAQRCCLGFSVKGNYAGAMLRDGIEVALSVVGDDNRFVV